MAKSSAHFTGEEAEAQRGCDLLLITHFLSGRAGIGTQASQAPCPTIHLPADKALLGTEPLLLGWGSNLVAQALCSWGQGLQISQTSSQRLAGLL